MESQPASRLRRLQATVEALGGKIVAEVNIRGVAAPAFAPTKLRAGEEGGAKSAAEARALSDKRVLGRVDDRGDVGSG